MERFIQVLPYLAPALFCLFAAIFGYSILQELTEQQLALVRYAPLALLISSMVLAYRFNRSRIFFTLLGLLTGYLLLSWFMPKLSGAPHSAAYVVLAFFMPLVLLYFSAVSERGILTRFGSRRFVAVFIMLFVVLWAGNSDAGGPIPYFASHFFDSKLLDATPIPQPAFIIMLIGVMLFNGSLFVKPCPQEAGLFASFIAAILTLHWFHSQLMLILVFGVVALVLMAAIVQESYSMAYIDELTELPGRRAMTETLKKLGNNYALAMTDIDHFKKFNDTHGHDTGDEVLRMVAGKLNTVTGGGKAFRYGGEEFCIVFSNKLSEEVLEHLEQVRAKVESSRFALRKDDRRSKENEKKKDPTYVTVTVSIGVAHKTPEHNNPWEVLKSADEALYKAKKKGRNQVCS